MGQKNRDDEAIQKMLTSLCQNRNTEEHRNIIIFELVRELVPVLLKKYSSFKDQSTMEDFSFELECKLWLSLIDIISVLPDHDIRNKTVVDLGCGSTGGTYEAEEFDKNRDGKQFEPWIMRACHELGAHAIGVDIGNLNQEPFEHHRVNLIIEDSLSCLKSNSADVVLIRSVYSSPELEEHNFNKEKLTKILYPQIKRVLKNGGVLLEDEIVEKSQISKDDL